MTPQGSFKKRGNAAMSVFDHICLHPGSTRAETAESVGLSVTSVGLAVDYLIDEGYVSARPGRSGGGRPAEELFPYRNYVFLADVREGSVRAFCLDLAGNVLFFEERAVCSPADGTDTLRDLVRRVGDSVPSDEGGYFAVAFLSSALSPVDPDAVRYAKTRLSPRFSVTYDPDLLSASVTVFKVGSRDAVLFCSVKREGVTASYCRRRGGEVVFGEFTKLTSTYGTGFGRVFTACRNVKEAAEALADALLNTVSVLSPDAVVVEISDGRFPDKFGNYLGGALSKNRSRAPDVVTYFRDEVSLRAYALSLIRRKPFEKEGKET